MDMRIIEISERIEVEEIYLTLNASLEIPKRFEMHTLPVQRRYTQILQIALSLVLYISCDFRTYFRAQAPLGLVARENQQEYYRTICSLTDY